MTILRCLTAMSMLLLVGSVVHGAEYQDAEDTAPTEVGEIDSSLDGIATEFERDARIVFDAINAWRERRGPFVRDGQVKLQIRSFDFDGSNSDGSNPQSWVAGGELSYQSGEWRDFLSLGASWYGSWKINGNSDADRTGLLQPDGSDISVLGKAFAEVTWNGYLGRFYRQTLDLPYLNRNDTRQIPNTFEAYGIGRKGSELDFIVGYVDRIKQRTDDQFVSMEAVAGGSGNGGTTMVGAWWNPSGGAIKLGAINQNTQDLFNTLYAEIDWERELNENLDIKLSGQYTDQRSVGANRLGDFETDTWGARLAASYNNAVLTLAYTRTGAGSAIRSPFGGRPSYLSLMVRNFDRANERAWRAGLSYRFDRLGIPGLSAFVNVGKGRQAIDATTQQPLPDQTEYDYTLDLRPQRGLFEGFWLRLRYARVDEDDNGEVTDQIRLILNYELPIL